MDKYKRKKAFQLLATNYELALPPVSFFYPNIIFLFDEKLAVVGREFLFARLNALAVKNRQTLVVTDIGWDRGGFYLSFDELGAGSDGDGYDVCIEVWGQNR